MPAARRSDVVHARLRGDILEGRLAPGDPVPSERALAEALGVNRHAVREALKRLEQAGLVLISQGGATRVQDWRETAGLEVLLDLVAAPGGAEPPPHVVRAVLEMRESIGVDAARRCAMRAGAAERDAVAALARQAAEAIRAAKGSRAAEGSAAAGDVSAAADTDALAAERYETFWRGLVAGAENIAYRLALNSLVGALAAHPDLAELLRPRDPDGLEALAAALSAGRRDDSGEAARRLLEPDTRVLG